MVEYKHLQRRSLNDSIMLNFNRHFDRDTDGHTGPITWLYASIVECWPTDALTVRCRTLCRQIYWLLIYPVYLVSPTTQHKTAFFFYKFDKNVWNLDTRLASFGLRRAARRVGVVGLDSDSGCRLLWVTAAGRRWQFSERDRRVWKSTIRCIVVFSWSWLVDTRHRTSALSTTLCVSSVHYYWNWYE